MGVSSMSTYESFNWINMKINKSKWKERLYTFYGFAVIVLAFIAGAFVLGVASKIFWNIFKVGWGLL
jgi:hypothetical protein